MPHSTTNAAQPALFEDHAIRREMHEGVWHWSIVDIITALTGSTNPRRYWTDLKRRLDDEGADQLYAKIVQLKMLSTDGKRYKTDAADMETVFRIIQSVPSPRAEPFKQWLSRIAVERLKEDADPSLAVDRAIKRYRAAGWSHERIKARIDGVMKRNELTEEWQKRGIEHGWQYGNLTNGIYRGAFGLDKKAICSRLGLKDKANPRQSMGAIELSLINLGETVAVELTRQRNASGYRECLTVVDEAGAMAGRARRDIEGVMGKPVLAATQQGSLLKR